MFPIGLIGPICPYLILSQYKAGPYTCFVAILKDQDHYFGNVSQNASFLVRAEAGIPIGRSAKGRRGGARFQLHFSTCVTSATLNRCNASIPNTKYQIPSTHPISTTRLSFAALPICQICATRTAKRPNSGNSVNPVQRIKKIKLSYPPPHAAAGTGHTHPPTHPGWWLARRSPAQTSGGRFHEPVPESECGRDPAPASIRCRLP